MRDLHVIVSNKIATYLRRDGNIICGNSDYQIVFAFDSEWDAYETKKARFKWNGHSQDVEFTGNTVAVPKLVNTTLLEVGVYVEDISTTTSAQIPCLLSCLCGDEVDSGIVLKAGSASNNGTYKASDEGADGFSEFTVNVPTPEATTEEKTVTPTKETQEVTPTTADYLSKVKVEAIPEEYVIPSGSESITSNGPHNVSGKATVEVNVPIPEGYIKPEGSITITENGPVDVTEKAEVIVEVESSGGDTTINGIVEQYKVNAGATVSAGDFVEFVTRYGNGTFNSGAVSYVSACKLDNSRVLVVYTSYAVVLNISGEIITVGTPIKFNTEGSSYCSVAALTDSKALVVYQDSSSGAAAIVLTIDGTDITAGTEKVVSSSANGAIAVVALSDSKALVAYSWGTSNAALGKAVVLTISGTTITVPSSHTQFSSDKTYQIVATALTDNKVLVSFKTTACKAVILTISGTTITVGTAVSVGSMGSSYQRSIVTLNENKALVTYVDSSGYGKAHVLTISETTITVGTGATFNSASTYYISAVVLNESKVLVTYRNNGNSYYGTAIILTIDGTTITAGTEKVFDYNTVTYTSLVAFSENSALVAYNNGSGAFSGITIDGTTITADGNTLGTYVQPATSRMHNVGIAKTGGTTGETVDVYCVG